MEKTVKPETSELDLLNEASEGQILTKCESCGTLFIEKLASKGLFKCKCGGKTWMRLVIKDD